MIPICLVTGFLGSGKTTLLKQLVRRLEGKRIVYLVNEFSSVDVDAGLLGDTDASVISIPGGSIFCRCLVTEFIGQLGTLLGEYHRPEAPLEGVVIEATGMADPRVMGDMLRETKLDAHFNLAAVISVVDPGAFQKLETTLASVRAQVEAATTVLINKQDLYDADLCQTVTARIKELNPRATCVPTSYCAAECEVFPVRPGSVDVHGELAACRDPHYASTAVEVTRNIDLEDFARRVTELREEFHRIKGFIPSDGSIFFVDYSHAGLIMEPAVPRGRGTTLVCILKGDASAEAREFVAGLGAVVGESGASA